MNETKQTIGSWQVFTSRGRLPKVRKIDLPHREASVYYAVISEAREDGLCRTVCTLEFGYGHKNAESFADLIAAAPDLYAAVTLAINLFSKGHAISNFNWGASALTAENVRELNELPGLLRAALAKARGEV